MSTLRMIWMVLIAAGIALGQGQFGAISGVVKDETGAVAPAVTVRIVNADTGVDLEVVSDDQGRYVAPQLLPGTYNITVRKEGFKQTSITGLKLDTNGNLTQDIQLAVGAVAESVNVSGQTLLVDTVTGSVGHVISNKTVLELPLNGRAAYNLVSLSPGSFVRQGTPAIVSIGGGRTLSATSVLDGVVGSTGGIAQQTIGFTPSVDALQEYRVEANSFSAQYGRSSAGIINATTKSGTNNYRGVLYWFVRNDAFDSRGWVAGQRASLRRNTFGGSLGGPIKHNKSFFFYNLEGLRERRAAPQTRTVPLEAWRTGDLSTLQRAVNTAQGPTGQPLVVYDPATNQQQAFPGNRIPASRLDPVAQSILKMVPAGNRTPDNPITQLGNFQENAVTPVTRDVHTMRVDHSFSDKTQVFGRYMLASPSVSPLAGPAPAWGPLDPNAIDIRGRSHSLSVNATRVVTPSLFISVRAGGTRTPETRSASSYGEGWPQKLGLNGVANDAFPRINLQAGLVPLTNLGAGGAGNVQYRFYAFQSAEMQFNLTKITGSHTFKAGYSHLRFNGNDENRQSASGIFGFGPQYTTGRTAAGAVIANTGSTISDFLLGRPDTVTLRAAPMMGRRIRHHALYVEDDYRLTSRLTLNLGMRYETENPFFEVYNRMSSFDPSVPHPLAGRGDIPANQMGAMFFPGKDGRPRYLARRDNNNIAPRFGFAFRPRSSNETVVRGGFGMFYGNPYDANVIQTLRAGFEGQGNYSFPVPFTLAQGVPNGALVTPPDSALTGAFGARGTGFATSAVEMVDPNRRTQYSINYNFTVQHQWKQILFDASYFANLGRKVPFPSINLNQIPTELLARTDIPERLKRPYTQFTGDRPDVTMQSPNFGLSNYHAFGLKVERRFAQGIGFMGSYTFAKWIDNVPFTGADDATWGDNDGYQNIYDRRNERSLSTNHIPHRLVMSPIWELPFGKGKAISGSAPVNWLIGGWQLSTIATLQSGSMFGSTIANGARDLLGDAATGRALRPNISANPNELAGRGQPAAGQRGLAWFNPGVFTAPARFTFGSAARTVIQGPGLVNFDLSVFKNFEFKERYKLQFRWEAFNATNTPFFDVMGDVFGQGNYGVVSAGNSKREMQFALKLYF